MGLSKDIIIKNKYIIKHKIGQGNFGKIFLGKNKYTNEEIAIKIDTGQIILKNEAIMYNYLSDHMYNKGNSHLFHNLLGFFYLNLFHIFHFFDCNQN